MPDPTPAAITTPTEWLLTVGRMADTPDAFLGGLCDYLLGHGLQLDRVSLHLATLHPQVVGIRVSWRRGIGAEETRYGYDVAESAGYSSSPLYIVYERGEVVRQRLNEPPVEGEFPILAELRAEGLTDYYVVPLLMPGGRRNACTWATSDPKGFSDVQIATIDGLLPALAACVEPRMLSRKLRGLLSIYLGADAGERVLAGTIRRGDGQTIAAAIWLCDMRDFTLISETLPRDDVIRLLNDFFEVMAGPVVDHGGQVLKFIGDAMLAIFPIVDDLDRDRACRTALVAAKEALARMDEANAARREKGEREIELGLALHTGAVMYGNIGAPERLDFTVIGPAVNLTARIAGLCRPLGRRLLASARFASPCGSELVSLGHHHVRGLHQQQEIFGLPDAGGSGDVLDLLVS